MRNFYIATVILLVGLALGLTFRGKSVNLDLSSRIVAFGSDISKLLQKSSESTNFENQRVKHAATMKQHLPSHLQAKIIGAADKEQLRRLYDEVYNYLLRSNDQSSLTFIGNIYGRLEAKNWLKKNDIRSMHRLYLMFREFDKADAFRNRYPDQNLPLAPHILSSENSGPHKAPNIRTIIRTTASNNSFELSEVDFSSFTGVVIVANPECHFFKNFLKGIGTDPVMADAFIDNTIWLTGKGASLTDNTIADWNQSMPNIEFQIVYSETDWPEINYWGSPSFYFFEDTKLVSKVVGWPRGQESQRKTALKNGFISVGINVWEAKQ